MVESGVGGYLPAAALNSSSWVNLPYASGFYNCLKAILASIVYFIKLMDLSSSVFAGSSNRHQEHLPLQVLTPLGKQLYQQLSGQVRLSLHMQLLTM